MLENHRSLRMLNVLIYVFACTSIIQLLKGIDGSDYFNRGYLHQQKGGNEGDKHVHYH